MPLLVICCTTHRVGSPARGCGIRIRTTGMDWPIDANAHPTEEISVREVFGIDSDMQVKRFYELTERVPEIDPTYKFDPETTLAILAGLDSPSSAMAMATRCKSERSAKTLPEAQMTRAI